MDASTGVSQWKTLRFVIVLVVHGLLVGAISPHPPEDELSRTLREGHRASVGQFQSCHAEIEIWTAPEAIARFKWWWTPERTKLVDVGSRTRSEILISGGRVRTVAEVQSREGSSLPSGTISQGDCYEPCDVWKFALFSFPGPDGRAVTLDQLFSTSPPTRAARWSTDEEKRLGVIRFVHDIMEIDLHFDPSVNYLVRRADFRSRLKENEGDGQVAEARITAFREVAPGMYFPECMELHRDGTLFQRVTFSKVELNRVWGSEVFALTYPHGAVISDRIAGSLYRVNASGDPIGPVTTRSGRTARPGELGATLALNLPGESRGPSKREPANWWLLVAPLAAALLVILLGIKVVRLRRRLIS